MLIVTSFVSCKKDWICNCTTTIGQSYIGGTPKSVTKKDAKAACNAIGATNGDVCSAAVK